MSQLKTFAFSFLFILTGLMTYAASKDCSTYIKQVPAEKSLIRGDKVVMTNEEGMAKLRSFLGNRILATYGGSNADGKAANVKMLVVDDTVAIDTYDQASVVPVRFIFIPGYIYPNHQFQIRLSDGIRILSYQETTDKLEMMIARSQKEWDYDRSAQPIRRLIVEKSASGKPIRFTVQNLEKMPRLWSLGLYRPAYWRSHTVELNGWRQEAVSFADESRGQHFEELDK